MNVSASEGLQFARYWISLYYSCCTMKLFENAQILTEFSRPNGFGLMWFMLFEFLSSIECYWSSLLEDTTLALFLCPSHTLSLFLWRACGINHQKLQNDNLKSERERYFRFVSLEIHKFSGYKIQEWEEGVKEGEKEWDAFCVFFFIFRLIYRSALQILHSMPGCTNHFILYVYISKILDIARPSIIFLFLCVRAYYVGRALWCTSVHRLESSHLYNRTKIQIRNLPITHLALRVIPSASDSFFWGEKRLITKATKRLATWFWCSFVENSPKFSP